MVEKDESCQLVKYIGHPTPPTEGRSRQAFEGYTMLTARKVQNKFGGAIVLEFTNNYGTPAMCFLPRRFSISLTDDKGKDLAVPSKYRFKCLGTDNSYDVKVWLDQ